MLSRLIDCSGWTAEQWLAATILVFIVITVIVVAHRVMRKARIDNMRKLEIKGVMLPS